MKKAIFALSLVGLSVAALSSCYAKKNTDMSYQFPNEISLVSGHADGNQLWAFASKTPLFEPGKPIQLDSEYVSYRLDSNAKLLRESPLGVGALRATEVYGSNGLAMVVGGLRTGKPESILYLTNDSGKTWTTTTAVSGAAVGAAFLGQDKIAIWSEKQVFVTDNWGHSWRQIQSKSSRLDFSSVKVPVGVEAVAGVPLVGIEYEKESRKTYSKLGVLNVNGEFTEKLSLEGRVIDMKQDGRGTLWVLLFEEGEKPKTRVLAVDNLLDGVRSREMREIPESIPQSLSVVDGTILVLYARWTVGSRMPLAFAEGVLMGTGDEIKWQTVDFEGSNPSKAFFSGKNGVWLYTKTDNRLSYQKWRD